MRRDDEIISKKFVVCLHLSRQNLLLCVFLEMFDMKSNADTWMVKFQVMNVMILLRNWHELALEGQFDLFNTKSAHFSKLLYMLQAKYSSYWIHALVITFLSKQYSKSSSYDGISQSALQDHKYIFCQRFIS